MEIERYDDGVPSWVDLGSPDLAKSKAFYGGLFGWDCPEGPPEAGGYSVCELRGKTVAGLGPQMNPDMPAVWMTYVNVDSADDTVAKVTANGGTVFVPPMDVMDAGRMAVFADPLGAVIGLWQPNAHMGAQLVNEPGTFCWSELITTDLDAAKAFYKRRVRLGRRGCRVLRGTAGLHGMEAGGRSVGGMMAKTAEMPADMPPNWGVYFAVADTDASVAKAQELGASRASWGRPTSSRGASPCWPTTSGAVFNILRLKS